MKTHSVSKVSKLMTMESLLHLDVQIQNRQPVNKKITEDVKVKLQLGEPARTGVQIWFTKEAVKTKDISTEKRKVMVIITIAVTEMASQECGATLKIQVIDVEDDANLLGGTFAKQSLLMMSKTSTTPTRHQTAQILSTKRVEDMTTEGVRPRPEVVIPAKIGPKTFHTEKAGETGRSTTRK